jgi:hypothetical protein
MRLQSTAQLAAKNHAPKLGFPRCAAADVSYNETIVAAASSAQLKRLPLGCSSLDKYVDRLENLHQR